MNSLLRILAFALVILALLSGHFPGDNHGSCGSGAAFAQAPASQSVKTASSMTTGFPASATEPASIIGSPTALPKMVDLGAGKCIACKKMVPVLEEAKKTFSGLATVEFIDVWENRDASSQYGIRMIPTQVFFDATGKEVFRHEGFFPMEDIKKQFESMGVSFKKAP